MSDIVERPWGTFESLRLEDNFQVKVLTIFPKMKISLQKHFKRSEHWVVVQGKAKVIVDDQIKKLSRNQAVFIPKESIHRIINESSETLKLVEVQVGEYFGEDDIERIEDMFDRV